MPVLLFALIRKGKEPQDRHSWDECGTKKISAVRGEAYPMTLPRTKKMSSKFSAPINLVAASNLFITALRVPTFNVSLEECFIHKRTLSRAAGAPPNSVINGGRGPPASLNYRRQSMLFKILRFTDRHFNQYGIVI